MDIEYLLLLQNFRNAIQDAWTPFMEGLSHFAVHYLIVIPVFIYWCVDKKKGLYTLVSTLTCLAVNAVVKLTVCAYRPWIRDARVIPAGNHEASGYSFPSGHMAAAAPVYGGVAVTFGKKRRWLAGICIVLILITGFSRNYLGVHTPQDVAGAILLSAAVLAGTYKLFRHLETHPEQTDRWLIAGAALGVAGLVFITFKSYPMDYVEGKLLVDPKTMMIDGYSDIGQFVTFCISLLIERHFIRFKEAGLNVKGILVSLVGAVPLYVIMKFTAEPLEAALGPHFGGLVNRSLLIIFAVVVWPAVIKLICGQKEGERV